MTLSTAIAHCFYMRGYRQLAIPRAIRRMLARTGFHRAWLAGWHGCFTDVDTIASCIDAYAATPRAHQGGTMNTHRDDLLTAADFDQIEATYDLDFSMHIEAELVENVEGLAGSGIRWPVLDAIVDCVAGRSQLRIETTEAIAYLRFLLAQGARHSWDASGYLLQLDLIESGETFGPGKTGDVVAESFAKWQGQTNERD